MTDAVRLEERDGGVLLQVRVSPGARRERLLGVHRGALKVAVAAPPEKGKANARVLEVLAGVLGLPPRRLSLVSGASAKDKTVRVQAVSAEELRRLLAPHLAG